MTLHQLLGAVLGATVIVAWLVLLGKAAVPDGPDMPWQFWALTFGWFTLLLFSAAIGAGVG